MAYTDPINLLIYVIIIVILIAVLFHFLGHVWLVAPFGDLQYAQQTNMIYNSIPPALMR